MYNTDFKVKYYDIEKELTTKQLNEYKNLIKLKKQISNSKIVVNVLSA